MIITPFSPSQSQLIIDQECIDTYGLRAWARSFQLGTAGYRDLLDPEALFSPEVPFNGVTMALIAHARGEIARERGIPSLHVGGEVRPHTQAFIELVSRIYAAKGITCHLRKGPVNTTPIWLSSFGVFHYGLGGGENFTASHSPSFKGGWKPMDGKGMQLMGMAAEISARVREVVEQASHTPVTIELASSESPLIRRDFEPLEAYLEALAQVAPEGSFKLIQESLLGGLKVAICTEGGSMGATARDLFGRLGWPMDEQGITLLHEEPSSTYHGIGVYDGVNHGVDPGKWQVYKHVGAQELLLKGAAHVVFIWDPDGDRFNIVTQAPAHIAEAAVRYGLEVEPLDTQRVLVYFKPNQIYFLLTALRVERLAAQGALARYDWSVAITFPTSRSIIEIAQAIGAEHGVTINPVLVPVGFKYFGELAGAAERAIATNDLPFSFTDVTGHTTSLGTNPRLLIMAEESGGAAMGSQDPIPDRAGSTRSIALKEKDGMQVGVTTLALAAELFNEGSSFAERYVRLMSRHNIVNSIYQRKDVTLYDESLKGEARAAAQHEAERVKEQFVSWFRGLTELTPQAATEALREKTDPTFPAIKRATWAGDGTLLEFEKGWFEIRASGTDAVLRFYFEGVNGPEVEKRNSQLVGITF